MKIGLKLWSTNDYYIQPAISLYEKKIFDYIELYIVPESLENITDWESVEIPFVLHAPHSLSGLNPSLENCEFRNFQLIDEVEKYRKALNPEFIIFHPGLNGSLKETIRQFCEIRRIYPKIHKCMVVENKPKIGLNKENCMGATPPEIKEIMSEAGTRFCFDIGHAICAANALDINWQDFQRDFLKLNPSIYHLSDGDVNSEMDIHLNYGSGTFDLSSILKQIPDDTRITIETAKTSKTNLADFEKDAKWLESNYKH